MSQAPSSVAEGAPRGSASLREGVYRYFFYGWLFRDADCGSRLERAIALRHNRDQAKWLPIYMGRWVTGGALILVLETLSEHLWGNFVLSAMLVLALSFVVLFLLITVICWAFLHVGRPSR
jgi:hypothetical protein